MNKPLLAALVLFLFSVAGCLRSVDPSMEARIVAAEKAAAKAEAANAALAAEVDRLTSLATAENNALDDVGRLQSELELTRDLLMKNTARIRSLEDTVAINARDQTRQTDLLALRVHREELECERLCADLIEQKLAAANRH